MGIIRQLPALLVNKIAAGEVVERPASVVKELIENSLDAAASRIVVSIEDGGRRLIHVADDGCGMTPDDVQLAVTAHATSKLASDEDLFSIGTLGFRGEALASIGAVSHLRLLSRTPDADEGSQIRVSGREIHEPKAIGCPPGTTVEVRDLFYNVPARRKFLRTTSTEMGQISEQFTRLSLAHPNVAFELSHNGRTSQKLEAGQSVQERIRRLFSAELADDLIPIQRDEPGLNISGFAAPPAMARSNGAWQFIFVNGRYIRDRALAFAIREAYRGLMEHDRHPVVFLFLCLEPDAVDVNVHPTKIEVRWRDGNRVRSQVLGVLRESLQRANLTPAFRTSSRSVDPAEAERLRHQMADWLKQAPPTIGHGTHSSSTPTIPGIASPGTGHSAEENFRLRPSSGDPRDHLFESWRPIDPARPNAQTADIHSEWGPRESSPPGPSTLDRGTPFAMPPSTENVPRTIQLHNTYLVSETSEGLIIIDQHALHERVIYEQLKERITAGPLVSQRLLLPETFKATASQMALLESHADLLHRLGIDVSPFGTDTVAVQAFPSILKDTSVRGVMEDLLDKLAETPDTTHTETVIHELLDMMACKAAVKAGDPLTQGEIDALIAQRDLVEKSSNCPHGRPTTLSISVKDLERQFKRT